MFRNAIRACSAALVVVTLGGLVVTVAMTLDPLAASASAAAAELGPTPSVAIERSGPLDWPTAWQLAADRLLRPVAASRAAWRAPLSPRDLGRALLVQHGWDDSQWGCLDALWSQESNWNPWTENASSGAYGIPQALPGAKMSATAADWRGNPLTQIRWGLGYIGERYGSPCQAWWFHQRHGYY